MPRPLLGIHRGEDFEMDLIETTDSIARAFSKFSVSTIISVHLSVITSNIGDLSTRNLRRAETHKPRERGGSGERQKPLPRWGRG